MALKVNGARLHTHVNRAWGGNAVAGIYGLGMSALRGNFIRGRGAMNNWSVGDHAITDVTDKSGLPNGYRHPAAWLLPIKAGAITSRNECLVELDGAGSGAEGLGAVGAGTVTINASALGGLIAGGVGSATISVLASGAIVATLGAPGSATISLGAVADLGALGWLTGAGEVSLTGDLIAYAIGHMEGTTEEAGLSPTGIANAVWAKIIESGFSASDILRLLVAHAGGDADGLGNINGTPEFMSIDGTTVRLAGTIVSGTRTVTTRDASE